ncbi:MAG: hypothetical protein WKF87_00140 [Chryseolinea sp.]
METLDRLKKNWNCDTASHAGYDAVSMKKVLNSRSGKQTKIAFRYFWASFALQILVYALLSHVAIKFWYDSSAVFPALFGILIFLPFTIMLLTEFRKMASMRIQPGSPSSIRQYVLSQRTLLQSFMKFKKRYELFLIPLSCAVGVFLTFKLYVPGGALGNPTGAFITLAASLVSCFAAIWRENKKHFHDPINELSKILDDFIAE